MFEVGLNLYHVLCVLAMQKRNLNLLLVRSFDVVCGYHPDTFCIFPLGPVSSRLRLQ